MKFLEAGRPLAAELPAQPSGRPARQQTMRNLPMRSKFKPQRWKGGLMASVALLVSAVGAFAQVDVSATGGVNNSYPTLGAAFTAINAGTHTGTITIGISANTNEVAVSAAL